MGTEDTQMFKLVNAQGKNNVQQGKVNYYVCSAYIENLLVWLLERKKNV